VSKDIWVNEYAEDVFHVHTSENAARAIAPTWGNPLRIAVHYRGVIE
jgi:hypothetical protein